MKFAPETFVKCGHEVSREVMCFQEESDDSLFGPLVHRFTIDMGGQKIGAFVTEPASGDVPEATAARMREIMEREAVITLQDILKRAMKDGFDADLNPSAFVARRFGWRVIFRAAWIKMRAGFAKY